MKAMCLQHYPESSSTLQNLFFQNLWPSKSLFSLWNVLSLRLHCCINSPAWLLTTLFRCINSNNDTTVTKSFIAFAIFLQKQCTKKLFFFKNEHVECQQFERKESLESTNFKTFIRSLKMIHTILLDLCSQMGSTYRAHGYLNVLYVFLWVEYTVSI